MIPLSQISYRRGLRTCEALVRGMEGRLVQLNFQAALDRVSHCDLLYKRGLQVLDNSSCSQYLSSLVIKGIECVCGKVSESVVVVQGVPQGSVLGPLLFILYTSKLFPIIGNHIVVSADETTIYAVIHRPLSRPQVMESLKQDLAATNFWYLKWHIPVKLFRRAMHHFRHFSPRYYSTSYPRYF